MKHQTISLQKRTILCNHSNSDLFTFKDNISCEKLSCFHTKGHLVYHWCLYNENFYLSYLAYMPVNKRDQLKSSLPESHELQV